MADVDISSETYGSFASVEEADLYLAADALRAFAWAALDDDAKGRGLVTASRLLLRMHWLIAIPAYSDPLPDALRDAACLLAADIVAKPELGDKASSDSNIRSAKAGSASVEFFRPVTGTFPLPHAVLLMLDGIIGYPDDLSAGSDVYVGGLNGDCCHAPGVTLDVSRYWPDRWC
jgi:hypothetical protein